MRLSYKYKTKCNDTTAKKANHCIELARILYNAMIEERNIAYRMAGKTLSGYDQKKEIPEIKDMFEDYKLYPSNIFQDVALNLQKTYNNFFRKIKAGERTSYPKFKGKQYYNSVKLSYATGYTIDGFSSMKLLKKQMEDSYVIDKGEIEISGIGKFKLFGFDKYKPYGVIKEVILEKDSKGKFWIVFSCSDVPIDEFICTSNKIGIDVGINKYLALSNGEFVENPKFLENLKREKRIIERSLSRKTRFSSRYKEVKKQLSNVSEKIALKRKDFQHKLAKGIVKKYDVIVCEKLNIKNMTKSAKGSIENPGKNVSQKSGLNRSLLDAAFSQFFEILKYKAKKHGKMLIQVNPKYTSQICNKCKHKDKENRETQARFVCKSCGHEDNADTNAAKNILDIGIAKINSVND